MAQLSPDRERQVCGVHRKFIRNVAVILAKRVLSTLLVPPMVPNYKPEVSTRPVESKVSGLILEESVEPVASQFRIPHGVLDIFMPHVMLD